MWRGFCAWDCNALARDIWLWCKEQDILLTAVHLPVYSMFEQKRHWTTVYFFCYSIIDLLAFMLNYKIKPYMSWISEPETPKYLNSWLNKWHIVCISSLQHPQACPLKSRAGRSNRSSHGTRLTNSGMVPAPHPTSDQGASLSKVGQQSIPGQLCMHPLWVKTQTDGSCCVRQTLTSHGFPEDVITIVFKLWRHSTKKTVWVICKKMVYSLWWEHNWKVYSANSIYILKFLNSLLQAGVAESVIITAWSQISNLLAIAWDACIGSYLVVIRFMKDVVV